MLYSDVLRVVAVTSRLSAVPELRSDTAEPDQSDGDGRHGWRRRQHRHGREHGETGIRGARGE